MSSSDTPSEDWGLGSPAGEQGASTRGAVGTGAPGGGFALIVRLAACAYVAVGIAVVWVAIALAPWGLLLLIVAFGAFGGAAILGLMAVGFAVVEEDERNAIARQVQNAHRITAEGGAS